MMPSNKKSSRATVYSSEEWLSRKDIIQRLWLLENKAFINVKNPKESLQDILRVDYGFNIT